MADPKEESDGGGFADALRRYVDAMVGVTEVSRERAERIMADLAKRGQTRTKDLQEAARELAERSARNRNELVRLVQKEIRRQIQTLGLATNDVVEKLQQRVDELEKDEAATRTKSASASVSGPKTKTAKKSRTKSATTKKQGS